MTDPTTAARSRRYRQRKAGELPPVERLTCRLCPRIHTGARGDLCARCWQCHTPEGRKDQADRVAWFRAGRKASQTTPRGV
jgi:hypothetical protein